MSDFLSVYFFSHTPPWFYRFMLCITVCALPYRLTNFPITFLGASLLTTKIATATIPAEHSSPNEIQRVLENLEQKTSQLFKWQQEYKAA